MSTTIRAGACAALLWSAALLGVTALVEPTREVVVLGPHVHAVQGAPVALLDQQGGYLRVRGLAPGFVLSLYANGAWLVLPARGGCGARAG